MASIQDNEEWLHRCECGGCRAVLWTDLPSKVMCLCSESWIDADGSFGGKAEETNDGKMKAWLKQDHKREAQLTKLTRKG